MLSESSTSILIYFFIYFFNWRIKLLYRILLFSVKPQHESAIGIHIFPPFWTSLPSPSPSRPSRRIQSPCLRFLRHSADSLAIYFTYGNVSFHVTLSIQITLSSPLPMPKSLFSMPVSPLPPCKSVLQYNFSRSRICELEYNTFVFNKKWNEMFFICWVPAMCTGCK